MGWNGLIGGFQEGRAWWVVGMHARIYHGCTSMDCVADDHLNAQAIAIAVEAKLK